MLAFAEAEIFISASIVIVQGHKDLCIRIGCLDVREYGNGTDRNDGQYWLLWILYRLDYRLNLFDWPGILFLAAETISHCGLCVAYDLEVDVLVAFSSRFLFLFGKCVWRECRYSFH